MTVIVSKPAINLREALSELQRPIGLKGSELMRADTAQEARKLIGAGRKNLIINGDMRISQRGSSFSGLSADQYTLDRFFVGSATSSFTVTKETGVALGARTVDTIKFTCTGSTTHWLDPYQGIEDFDYIQNKTVTLSAWARTNHPSINFRQYSTKNIGATFVPDGQWRYYSATTTLGSLALTRGVNSAFFGITNSANSTWSAGQYVEFTEFQIEVGEVATEFEKRSLTEELSLCERYFFVLDGGRLMTTSNGNAVIAGNVFMPTTMRSSPSITYLGGNSTSGNVRFYTAGAGNQVAYDVVANTITTAFNSTRLFGFNSGNISLPSGYGAWVDLGTGTNFLKITGSAEL